MTTPFRGCRGLLLDPNKWWRTLSSCHSRARSTSIWPYLQNEMKHGNKNFKSIFWIILFSIHSFDTIIAYILKNWRVCFYIQLFCFQGMKKAARVRTHGLCQCPYNYRFQKVRGRHYQVHFCNPFSPTSWIFQENYGFSKGSTAIKQRVFFIFADILFWACSSHAMTASERNLKFISVSSMSY